MTEREWMEQAAQNRDVLRELIAVYHPSSHARNPQFWKVQITAPNAEHALNAPGGIRDQIRAEVPEDPAQLFDTALSAGDFDTTYSLLNGAWFGVPESTSCWMIRGFKEAVELLEDPPEPDEEVTS